MPKNDGTITTVPRVEATCETAGNILYYIKNAKYYSDSNCTVEITLAETVIPATGHAVAAGLYTVGNVTCSRCGETVTPTLPENTLYFLTVSSWNWTTCSVHLWGGANATTWETRLVMTSIGTVTLGTNTYTVWKADATAYAGFTGMVFTKDGTDSNKTDDLSTVTGANCYLSNYDSYYSTAGAFVYVEASN